uniref:Uncharacterized protein n=1 Tax=Oryza barthii TaxID=65489 RepID=A0A0D3GAA9_9ORYZ
MAGEARRAGATRGEAGWEMADLVGGKRGNPSCRPSRQAAAARGADPPGLQLLHLHGIFRQKKDGLRRVR